MASKILGMFWLDVKVSSFWRYNPTCVQISDGLLGRAFSLEIFLGGSLKETHFPSPTEFENWDTEIGQVGGKQAAWVTRGCGLSALKSQHRLLTGSQHPRTPGLATRDAPRAPEAGSWGPGQHVCSAGRWMPKSEGKLSIRMDASSPGGQWAGSSELGLCWEPGGKDKQASSPNVFSRFLSHFLKGMNVSVFP